MEGLRSLAVLPFENLSGDPAQDYFSDGTTDALITELGKISALRVISRQSMMQYKDTKKTAPQIARELMVDALVEGSGLRVGDRVRVSAQLIEGTPERISVSERAGGYRRGSAEPASWRAAKRQNAFRS